ncbi:hypothetical protein ABW19_dt0202448 [Dactylella cylindrospora]|nr:hypothetical protein ABW19_dt0202448 [Dactylella cylindrospora]
MGIYWDIDSSSQSIEHERVNIPRERGFTFDLRYNSESLCKIANESNLIGNSKAIRDIVKSSKSIHWNEYDSGGFDWENPVYVERHRRQLAQKRKRKLQREMEELQQLEDEDVEVQSLSDEESEAEFSTDYDSESDSAAEGEESETDSSVTSEDEEWLPGDDLSIIPSNSRRRRRIRQKASGAIKGDTTGDGIPIIDLTGEP